MPTSLYTGNVILVYSLETSKRVDLCFWRWPSGFMLGLCVGRGVGTDLDFLQLHKVGTWKKNSAAS